MKFSSDLKSKLKNQFISSRVLLDKLRLVDEQSRKSSQYQDPTYLPFYFYLSKFISPKRVLQVGFNLGLEICCFLQGNKDVEYFLGFQDRKEDVYYSERLALSNIKTINNKLATNFYYGKIYDESFINNIQNFDLVLINEKSNFDQIKDSLTIFWDKLNLDGYLVLDYLNYNKKINKIFIDFCKSKNKEGSIFRTRYGVGMLQK